MSEPEVKSKKVTFEVGPPLGTRAIFTHEGERWIAYPQVKSNMVAAVIDRLVGTVAAVHDDLVRWINRHPEDAADIARIMARTAAAQELAREKVQAWTQ